MPLFHFLIFAVQTINLTSPFLKKTAICATCKICTFRRKGHGKEAHAQHITAHHSTSQHITAHHSTSQHITAHHSTSQHITAHHSTSQAISHCTQILDVNFI
jgi:hypothetical protein